MKSCAKILFAALLMVAITASTLTAEAKQSRFRKGSEVRGSTKDHNIIREDGKMVIYKKHNVVDFDDSLIEGEVKNPGEFYFVHRPEEKFGSLVKKRANFHKEMLRDTVMIR